MAFFSKQLRHHKFKHLENPALEEQTKSVKAVKEKYKKKMIPSISITKDEFITIFFSDNIKCL